MGIGGAIRLGVLVASLGACADVTAPPVEPTLADALPYVQLAEPLAAAGIMQLGAPIGAPLLRLADRCDFRADTERFECAPLTIGAETYRRHYQLLDPRGVAQSAWNREVVAIRLITETSGSVTGRDEATLSGLRSPIQTLTGEATLTWTAAGLVHRLRRRIDVTLVTRIVIADAFPTGAVQLLADREHDAHAQSVSLRFDGTSIVSMLASFDNAAALACTVDLRKADLSPDCGGR